MKRKLVSILAVVLVLTTCLATGAMAASSDPAVSIRVNGTIVQFPDGQPYIDSNGRTMIPVRFVTEALGAKVSWNGPTSTAVIEKDGIKVEVPIGSNTISVTQNGKTTKTQMDTAAVLKDGRTYVPIRFVAEAIGAFVDYSSTYHTVGIYQNVLTAEEISMLQTYPYTQQKYAIGYEDAKSRLDEATLAFRYGTCRESFTDFANAREFLYHDLNRTGKYYFEGIKTILNNAASDVFYDTVVEEAAAEIDYQSERLTVKFLSDDSCVYQADSISGITTCVRGIVVTKLSVKPTDLTGDELDLLARVGFAQLYKDRELRLPVDVHMNTVSGYQVDIHTCVALDVIS